MVRHDLNVANALNPSVRSRLLLLERSHIRDSGEQIIPRKQCLFSKGLECEGWKDEAGVAVMVGENGELVSRIS